MTDEHDVYVAEAVRHQLATDPRVADPSFTVEVAGGRLHILGTVATEERRRAALEVAHEAADGREVVDDITLVPYDGAGEPEHLT
jgi:osmotically-inducible protein OsmY